MCIMRSRLLDDCVLVGCMSVFLFYLNNMERRYLTNGDSPSAWILGCYLLLYFIVNRKGICIYSVCCVIIMYEFLCAIGFRSSPPAPCNGRH